MGDGVGDLETQVPEPEEFRRQKHSMVAGFTAQVREGEDLGAYNRKKGGHRLVGLVERESEGTRKEG